MARRRYGWARLPTEELLDVRLSDLRLSLPDSPLAPRLQRLERELAAAGLAFRPRIWLSTDWFSPSGVPGFAIPFFLAHPRLQRLERQQMLDVEGGSVEWCMQLMRHETGHAIDNAYRLHWRRRWREHFGPASAPYRPSYVPRPSSRRHVLHLANWYAQSHPIEDFAETFAVWLQPHSRWRVRYKGWPVLRKLLYVDELMDEIAEQRPVVRSRERTDSLPGLRMTLREYYRRKKEHYGEPDRSVYDRDLRRLFSDSRAHRHRRLASSFLRDRQADLRGQVSFWTGQHAFVVDQVLRDMIARSRDLRLRLARSERETSEGAAVLLTMHAVRLLRRRDPEYFR